jgi:hypothetical protein
MNRILLLTLLTVVILLSACTFGEQSTPNSLPAAPVSAPTETTVPTAAQATEPPTLAPPVVADPATTWQSYANRDFGLSFQFPPGWYGPDEYVSDGTLRVAVGSDVIYPYGTDRTEQIYTQPDSYYVTLQYSQNDPESFWPGTYETLLAMQDGESQQSARGLVIRQRAFDLGRLKGIEFISTLPDTAQTEPLYIRQVVLLGEPGEVLVVMGTPNNVQVGEAGWREAYQAVDEANLPLFRQLVESIVVQ